jgi:hypothetical protein
MRVTVVAIFLLCLALSAPGGVGATVTPISDGDDTKGRLDIKSVTTTTKYRSGRLTNPLHTVTMYHRWPSKLLSGANGIEVFYDTKGDRRPERIAVAFYAGGHLRGALFTRGGRYLGTVGVKRPSSKSIFIGLFPTQLGSPAGYRWAAYSFYKSATSCPNTCLDRAPNRGLVRHDITPPRISFPGSLKTAIGRLLPIPATTSFDVDFNLTDNGGSGIGSWKLREKAEPDGSWTQIANGTSASNSVARSENEGSAFTYEVTALDGDNNQTMARAVKGVPFDDAYLGGNYSYQDPSFLYSGAWTTTGASADDYLGTLHTAGSGGGIMQFYQWWGYVALIGPATCGTATVSVSGGGVTPIEHDVQAPCDGRRRVVLFQAKENGVGSMGRGFAVFADEGFSVDGVIYVPTF